MIHFAGSIGTAKAVPNAAGNVYTVLGLKVGSTAILYGNGSQLSTTTVDSAGKATWTLSSAPTPGTVITYDGTYTGSGGTVPIVPGPAPVWTSASAYSIPEGQRLSQTLAANNTTSYGVVGGADAALFTVVGSTLSLLAKDFELPTDTNTDNIYQVVVRAIGPSGFADQAIAVTVTDVAPTATDNLFSNPNFTGGTAGSPGTLPSGISTGGFAGLTRTVSFGSLSDGRGYVDIRFAGTATGTNGQFFIQPQATVPSSTLEKVSIEGARTAGSWNGITSVNWLAEEYTSASAYVKTNSAFSFIDPSPIGPTRTRFDYSFTTSSTTGKVSLYAQCGVTNGAAVDFTLRLVQPYIGANGVGIDPVADAEPSPLVTNSLIWSDEFSGTAVSLSDTTTSRDWRPNDFYQQINRGYADFAANTYNVAPAEPGYESYNPFSVANGMLTISAKRIPAGLTSTVRASMDAGGQSSVATPSWMSGILITDQVTRKFKYGYIEWRMSLPNPGKGIASALWLYGTDGNNNPDGKGQVEIDVLETLSGLPSGRPWFITLHKGTNSDAGTQVNVGSFNDDTTMWHNYGLDWQPTYLKFYKDNVLVASITGADAAYFNTTMGIRIGNPVDFRFVSDPNGLSDSSTPNPMLMNIDYVRVYPSKPY